MDWIFGIAAILALILIGFPIAFSMTVVGFLGIVAFLGVNPALAILGETFFSTGMSYTLSVMPLFILMGNFIVQAGLADELYAASNAWLRHRRGGLAMATVVACGGFSSVCGSSLATAATMARVSMPSMRRYGYSDRLAAGAIASGGTLGILIPPSVILVLYGIMTRQPIGELFLAGIVPGLIGILGYMAAVRLSLWITGEQTRTPEPLPMIERLRALRGVIGVLGLFLLVIGGIYLGVFTATEAASVGAAGAFLIALARRRLGLRRLYTVLLDTAKVTTMMFFLLFGATLFSAYVNLAGLPADLAHWLQSLDVGPLGVVLAILVVYLVLGAVLESLSMMLLTVPIFYPVVEAMGLDLIWFGIIVVVAVEISLITPPIGLNVLVLKTILPDVRAGTVFRGVVPFVAVDLVRLMLLVLVPSIVLFLPSTM